MKFRPTLAVLGLLLSGSLAAGQENPAQPQRPQTKPPNVLFIAVDDLNDWVGFLQGHPQVKTPNLDRLARRGMVFANAHCAAPLCCPSRAAVFSGRQPFRTGVYDNDANIQKLHPDTVLLPRYFAENGYRTLGTGKLLHHTNPKDYHNFFDTEQRWSPFANAKVVAYTKDELATKPTAPRHLALYGTDKREIVLPLNRMPSDRNPKGPAGESFDWGPFDIPDEEMGDGRITTWAIGQLTQRPKEPFFLGVGYYRPHIPLYAPRRFFEMYPEASIVLPKVLESDLDDLSKVARHWAVEPDTAGAHQSVVKHGQWKAAVAGYLACVSFVDAQIGRLLDALEQSPYAQNTIIVIWSDHGWHLGEKQHWGKWTGWERATRVPLLIVPAAADQASYKIGALCKRTVGLIDLYPTLIELCGLPVRRDLDGQSLVPLLKDPTRETRPIVTTFDYENYSLRTDRWRFIRYRDGSEELYDHDADPDEWRNLAGDAGHDSVRERLRSLLPRSPATRAGAPGKGN